MSPPLPPISAACIARWSARPLELAQRSATLRILTKLRTNLAPAPLRAMLVLTNIEVTR